MLDLIEVALQTNSFGYQRIDGQTPLSRRIGALDIFNTDPNCTVMLASIGSIGEGYVESFQTPGTSHSC
jgi:SNF2 family DNA or RNA helicase